MRRCTGIELLKASEKVLQREFDSVMTDLNEIVSMLVSSIKTLKNKLNEKEK